MRCGAIQCKVRAGLIGWHGAKMSRYVGVKLNQTKLTRARRVPRTGDPNHASNTIGPVMCGKGRRHSFMPRADEIVDFGSDGEYCNILLYP